MLHLRLASLLRWGALFATFALSSCCDEPTIGEFIIAEGTSTVFIANPEGRRVARVHTKDFSTDRIKIEPDGHDFLYAAPGKSLYFLATRMEKRKVAGKKLEIPWDGIYRLKESDDQPTLIREQHNLSALTANEQRTFALAYFDRSREQLPEPYIEGSANLDIAIVVDLKRGKATSVSFPFALDRIYFPKDAPNVAIATNHNHIAVLDLPSASITATAELPKDAEGSRTDSPRGTLLPGGEFLLYPMAGSEEVLTVGLHAAAMLRFTLLATPDANTPLYLLGKREVLVGASSADRFSIITLYDPNGAPLLTPSIEQVPFAQPINEVLATTTGLPLLSSQNEQTLTLFDRETGLLKRVARLEAHPRWSRLNPKGTFLYRGEMQDGGEENANQLTQLSLEDFSTRTVWIEPQATIPLLSTRYGLVGLSLQAPRVVLTAYGSLNNRFIDLPAPAEAPVLLDTLNLLYVEHDAEKGDVSFVSLGNSEVHRFKRIFGDCD